jgi:hypothetical protein
MYISDSLAILQVHYFEIEKAFIEVNSVLYMSFVQHFSNFSQQIAW